MTCSSGTKRSPSGMTTKRGSSGGTFTRAKRRVAGLGVVHDHREVERQVGDVRERVAGVDRERGEHREDAVARTTSSRYLRSSSSSSSQAREARCPASARAGHDVVEEDLLGPGQELADAGRGSRRSCCAGRAAVGRCAWRARRPPGPSGRRPGPGRTRRGSGGRWPGTSPARAAGPRASSARASTRALKSSQDSSRLRKRSEPPVVDRTPGHAYGSGRPSAPAAQDGDRASEVVCPRPRRSRGPSRSAGARARRRG